MEGGNAAGGLISALIWMIILMAIFYFLIIRPQQQQRKKHEEFLKNLKKGDKVITTGGIIGEVRHIDEKTVSLKVAEGTVIKFIKNAIATYYQEDEKENKQKT